MMDAAVPSRKAREQARQLVLRLRKSNQRIERTGGVRLPEEEYALLEEELTRKLLKRAA
jgi:hypothetical protein